MTALLTRRSFLQTVSVAAGACCAGRPLLARAQELNQRPNIVFVLADDLGMGDLGCYNPDSSIPTPYFDRVAREGMRFTDAHSPGAVCVPSRYGIMTGRYYWRGENRGLNGYSKNVVELDRMTLAEMLRNQDYHTNFIGKWHLGLGDTEPVDFAQHLRPNPTDHGFDYYFGIPASLDMPPYCYVENGRAIREPSEHIEGTPHRTGGFFREGAISPGFSHEQVVPQLTELAVQVVQSHTSQRNQQPLFLYFALPAPHTPWLPVESARGKSGVGDYGDFVHQVDRSLGAIVEALDRTGMAENTLLIVASDNGGLQSWLPPEYDHQMNLGFRGQKGDIWEGGHRIPLIMRWPGQITAGATSDALVSLTDLLSTLASVTGAELPGDAAEDSFDLLPALHGEPGARTSMVHDSLAGFFGLRDGQWKLILGLGGGGLGYKPEEHQPAAGEPPGQLYNLAEDPGEQRNLYTQHPEIVARLSEKLQLLQATGSRSALGSAP